MRRQIILHGHLATFCTEPIVVEGDTIFQLLELVTLQHPAFRPDPVKGRVRIKVVGFETEASLYQQLGDLEVIHIVPQLNGGKSGGFMQILVGAALIAASFIPGLNAVAASYMMKVGAMALLGGLAQMLAPTPESPGDAQKSGYLGSPKNTTAIGTTIPILYGEHKAFGHILAFDINAIEFKAEKGD